ncbi:MAG: PqqD family protein [Thermoanaerobaculia bacterium]|nr:PqqD family protein [Thermoanaerobaculia bacterium]
MPSPLTLDSVVCVSDSQVSARVGEEVVILELGAGQYFSLEGTGPEIWKLVQKPIRVSEIRNEILRSFEVEPDVCERDLLQVLQEMVDKRILDELPPTDPPI